MTMFQQKYLLINSYKTEARLKGGFVKKTKRQREKLRKRKCRTNPSESATESNIEVRVR